MTVGTAVNIGSKPDPVTLSDKAAAKVAELLSEEEGGDTMALRVAVKSGGCSGFSYDMYFDSEFADDDVVRTFQQGAEIGLASRRLGLTPNQQVSRMSQAVELPNGQCRKPENYRRGKYSDERLLFYVFAPGRQYLFRVKAHRHKQWQACQSTISMTPNLSIQRRCVFQDADRWPLMAAFENIRG